MNAEAAQLISTLGLAPLPQEGGFYAVTWVSAVKDAGGRPTGSAIVFLITPIDFSALHRLGTDEIWHFHAGDPAELVELDPRSGASRLTVLGPDVAAGHAPQAVVRSGMWQGARPCPGAAPPRGWTLLGCTLSPAWDAREFELGDRESLLGQFPTLEAHIRALTR